MTDDGGPAFPKPCDECSHQGCCGGAPPCSAGQSGMSLRDWFAGMALSGNPQATEDDGYAAWAYKVADAMLAERQKRED